MEKIQQEAKEYATEIMEVSEKIVQNQNGRLYYKQREIALNRTGRTLNVLHRKSILCLIFAFF